jgi:putative hydrolase of the HAD superfamily
MIKAVVFDLGNTLISQEDGITFPYALEVLTQLKSKYKLALITNTQPPTNLEKIQELLHNAQLEGFFEEKVVSTEVGISKPNPRIFEMVLEKLGVNPEEAVMVGNIISTDIFGGNRVGMRTVLLQLGEEYQRSSWEHPDHIIHSLRDLLDLMKKQS